MEYIEDYDDYIAENNILGNVRSYKEKFFICIPRWRDGVPATLNTLKTPDAKLRPFPNLETNIVGKCQKALQNVAAIEVEPFGESLWVVDSGTSALFSRPNKDCHAKLVKIDVKNQHFEVLHVFGREVITEKVASYFISFS